MRVSIIALLTSILFVSSSFSQIFTKDNSTGFEGFSGGSVDWVDYDNDGDLDLFLIGSGSSLQTLRFYNNDGGNFTADYGTGIPSLRRTRSAWADFNNDGFIDLALSGIVGGDDNPTYYTYLLKNNADGTFESHLLPNNKILSDGDMQWGDLDRDGDLDFIISGFNTSKKSETAVYSNNGDETFSRVYIPIRGIQKGNLSLGDKDNDGDLDILISGRYFDNNSENGYFAEVYTNNGNWNFSPQALDLDDPYEAKSAWADLTNDGILDIVVAGRTLTSNYSITVFEGTGSSFNEIENAGLLPIGSECQINIYDFDSDGKLDVALYGSASIDGNYEKIFKLFKNNGNKTFTEFENSGLPKFNSLSLSVADFDQDGDLDLATIGWDESYQRNSNIYINGSDENTTPSVPTNLSAAVSGNGVTLSWDESIDTETPSASLSYNVRVGTSAGSNDVMAAMSIADGSRQTVDMGNANFLNEMNIKNLANGTYYFAVQAIDNGMQASAFSSEITFDISSTTQDPLVPESLSAEFLSTDEIFLSWIDLSYDETGFELQRSTASNNSYETIATLPANVSSYTDQVIDNNTQYFYRIQSVRNDDRSDFSTEKYIKTPSKGAFFKSDNVLMGELGPRSVASAILDINQDGLDDIFILNSGDESYLYKNLGNSDFEEITNNDLVDLIVNARSCSWADYNNDGLPDVLITTSGTHYLFKNNGNFAFTEVAKGHFFTTYDAGGSAWGDLNNDGYLDVYISNYNASGDLHLNNGDDTFTKVTDGDITNEIASTADATFIDINGDHHIDLYVPVYFENGILYFNDGKGNLVKQSSNLTSLSGASVGSSWADYDLDGDFDVMITNNVNGPDWMYTNDGNGNFTSESNGITQAYIQGTSSAWIDFDNDGDEDFVMITDAAKALFQNDGNGDFNLVDEYSLANTAYAYAISVGDLDQNGFLDLVVANGEVKNETFFNHTNNNHWIKLSLEGTINNRDAIGVKARVITNATSQIKQIISNSGANSTSSKILHFGLGSLNKVDIEVIWPNNGIQVLTDQTTDQLIEIKEASFPKAPVDLTSNITDNDDVSLTWKDESSTESGFIIERSVLPFNQFVVIDSVDTNTSNYMDVSLKTESKYYYRVKAYTEKGYSLLSNTTEVHTSILSTANSKLNLQGLNIFPNPAHEILNIEWKGTGGMKTQLTIVDLSGVELFRSVIKLGQGGLSSIDISNIKPGYYIVVVRRGKNTSQHHLIIK